MNPESLYARTTKGVKFALDRMRRMCAAAGDPQTCAPAVLIAGTNGKGSVAAMWDAGLRAAGKRVGLYTSPHLVRFGERVRVDGIEQELDAAYEELLRCEEACGFQLTFFEAATFMAFVRFREARVDWMVLEVGMGGRLDATNVCEPRVCVITTIGLDHEEFLGSGEAAIAAEKAGIIRPGVPVTLGRIGAEPRAVILARAAEAGAPVSEIGTENWGLTPVLKGRHQRDNAAVFALSARGILGEQEIVAGTQARWPGRYDEREWKGVRVVLDGAHNPPAYEALAETLDLERPSALIFGATDGRAHVEGLRRLAALVDEVVLCEPQSPRAIKNEVLSQVVTARCEETVGGAFESVRHCKSVVLCGSLYLVGDAIAFLEGGARQAVADFR